MRRRKISVSKYRRTSKLGLEHPVVKHSRHIRDTRHSKVRTVILPKQKITNQVLRDARKDKEMWAQPERVPVPIEATRVPTENRSKFLAKINLEEMAKWNTTTFVIDQKIRGIRAIVIYDPKTKEVKLLSRTGKQLPVTETMANDIRRHINPKNNGIVMLDTELYAEREVQKGEFRGLQQNAINGFVHAPNDPKYADVIPSFHVFDVMVWDDKDMRSLPLDKRKDIIEANIPYETIIRPVEGYTWYLPFRRLTKDQYVLEALANDIDTTSGEGIIIKDGNQPYMHQKGGKLHWIKIKKFETAELRLLAVHAYPDPNGIAKDKKFKYYRHWELGTADARPVTMRADKGMRGAGLDDDYYIAFTKNMLKQLDENDDVVGTGRQIPVTKKMQSIYGRKTVPEEIMYIRKKEPIVEVYAEDMSKNLKMSGIKIVGFRPDKKTADRKKDLQNIYNTFYKV